MKKIIFLISILFIVANTFADCASEGIKVYPNNAILKQNSNIIITGYGDSQELIKHLNEGYFISLSAYGFDDVELKLESIHKGMRLIQAVLVPQKSLRVGRTYTLNIKENEYSENLAVRVNTLISDNSFFSWKVEEGFDEIQPVLLEGPTFIRENVMDFGCGPAISTVFDIKAKDDSPFFILTELVVVDSEESKTYYLPYDEKEIVVGHGMCSGGFTYKEGVKYKIRFRIVDICGNKNKSWTSWIYFDSPI